MGTNQSIYSNKKDTKWCLILLAERMGFEPMCPKSDNRISSAARYDLFDTFPYEILSFDVGKQWNAVPALLLHYITQGLRPSAARYDLFDTFPYEIEFLRGLLLHYTQKAW